MPRTPRKLPGVALPSWLQGVWPVVLIMLVGLGGIVLRPRAVHDGVLLSLALAATAAVLLIRVRAPLAALAFVLAISIATDYGPITSLAALLALLNVVLTRDRITIGITAIAVAAVFILTPAVHGHPLATIPPILSRMVAVGLAIAVGLYLRARSDYISGLHERAERLEREQELLAAQAVADERVRIARELHDVVAHNVSLMVVQAQALAATGAGSQERASLERIAGIGREALSEMHRMLGVLRIDNGQGPERAPQPGVRDLDGLIARTRDAGLAVTLEVDGEARELPSAIDLSAYRIVQEALTNVIRHAHAQRVGVTLGYRADAIDLCITDDGNGSAEQNGSGGHGLIGMRERAALFGGRLEAGPRTDGHGFQVRASLPLS